MCLKARVHMSGMTVMLNSSAHFERDGIWE